VTSISSVTRRSLALALTHAAAYPSDATALEAAVNFADSVNRFLENFGLRQVFGAGTAGDLTRAEWVALTNRGEALWAAGRAREAIFCDLLARIPAARDAWDYERALTSNRIGRQRAAPGRPEQAAAVNRDALAGLAQLAQRVTVRRQTDVTRTNLADALTDLRRYVEAQQEYEASLV
jgi:tetratricopeptide (TPR) repeat protein